MTIDQQITAMEGKYVYQPRMGWVKVEDGKIPTFCGPAKIINFLPEKVQYLYDTIRDEKPLKKTIHYP